MREVAHARHCRALAELDAAATGARHHGAPVGHAEARADAGGVVHELAAARGDGDLLHHAVHEGRHHHRELAAEVDARFLARDGDARIALARVVGDHGASDAVLELRDHLAGTVVGAGVGAEDQHDVQVEAHGVAADLDVALLEHIEEAHLHQFVQVGQLVHGEDAAVHARHQPEVERFLRAHRRAGGELRGVDLADQVGELGAGCQALGVARVAVPPGDGHLLRGERRHQLAACARDRVLGVLVHGASRNVEVRQPFVEEPRKHPHEAALSLALLAEEQDVVARDDGRGQFREDGVVVAQDPGEESCRAALAASGCGRQRALEVGAELFLDGAALPAGSPEFCEGTDGGRGGHGRGFAARGALDAGITSWWCPASSPCARSTRAGR